MASTTAGRDAKRSEGHVVTALVEAGEVIYSGSLVSIDADGYAIPAGDTAATSFLGVSADTVDNTSGADGDKKVAVYVEGTFELAFSGTATQGAYNVNVYAVDNQTVALAATTTNDVLVGKVVEFIDASTVRVKI